MENFVFFKSCPKCNGDIYIDDNKDLRDNSLDVVCIQCGWRGFLKKRENQYDTCDGT